MGATHYIYSTRKHIIRVRYIIYMQQLEPSVMTKYKTGKHL